jgi:hypothetical protein
MANLQINDSLYLKSLKNYNFHFVRTNLKVNLLDYDKKYNSVWFISQNYYIPYKTEYIKLNNYYSNHIIIKLYDTINDNKTNIYYTDINEFNKLFVQKNMCEKMIIISKNYINYLIYLLQTSCLFLFFLPVLFSVILLF